MYYVVCEQKIIRTTILITQTRISISLRFLINNSLKRKQKYLTNKSCLFSIVVILENTILNYLFKRLKLNLISTISILSFLENLTNETNVSQTL